MEIAELRHYIERALEHAPPTHTVQDVLDGIARGELKCWPGRNSAVVTTIQVYPRRKVLCIWLAAGHLDELQAMLPEILDWGRSEGCASAFIAGRPGWLRTFLTKTGDWQLTDIVLEKTL